MKPIADFHMHTVFCDGKNTPEEMVLRGMEMGLSVIGFSVHSPLWEGCSWAISTEKVADYRKEIERLRVKYADRIRVYCGRRGVGYRFFDYAQTLWRERWNLRDFRFD